MKNPNLYHCSLYKKKQETHHQSDYFYSTLYMFYIHHFISNHNHTKGLSVKTNAQTIDDLSSINQMYSHHYMCMHGNNNTSTFSRLFFLFFFLWRSVDFVSCLWVVVTWHAFNETILWSCDDDESLSSMEDESGVVSYRRKLRRGGASTSSLSLTVV